MKNDIERISQMIPLVENHLQTVSKSNVTSCASSQTSPIQTPTKNKNNQSHKPTPNKNTPKDTGADDVEVIYDQFTHSNNIEDQNNVYIGHSIRCKDIYDLRKKQGLFISAPQKKMSLILW